MGPLIALISFVLTLLLLAGVIAAVTTWFENAPDRQRRKAERLRAELEERKAELDTLRSSHDRLQATLVEVEQAAETNAMVDNLFAHQVLETIRKEK